MSWCRALVSAVFVLHAPVLMFELLSFIQDLSFTILPHIFANKRNIFTWFTRNPELVFVSYLLKRVIAIVNLTKTLNTCVFIIIDMFVVKHKWKFVLLQLTFFIIESNVGCTCFRSNSCPIDDVSGDRFYLPAIDIFRVSEQKSDVFGLFSFSHVLEWPVQSPIPKRDDQNCNMQHITYVNQVLVPVCNKPPSFL